jgi:hypothetical protein
MSIRMTAERARCAVLAALVLCMPACGSSSNGVGSADSGAKGSGGSDAGVPDASHAWQTASDAGQTVNLDEQVIDSPSFTALAGVKVCVYPALTVCQTTDQDGHAVLSLPANSSVAIAFEAVDHHPLLITITTRDVDLMAGVYLNTRSVEPAWADAAGFTVDPAKGMIFGEALGQLDGVTMTLTPSSGAGPVYFGGGNLPGDIIQPDKTATATSTSGYGSALFANVAPGDYTVSFSGTLCSIGTSGWQGIGQGVARVPVVAGYLTSVAADCN